LNGLKAPLPTSSFPINCVPADQKCRDDFDQLKRMAGEQVRGVGLDCESPPGCLGRFYLNLKTGEVSGKLIHEGATTVSLVVYEPWSEAVNTTVPEIDLEEVGVDLGAGGAGNIGAVPQLVGQGEHAHDSLDDLNVVTIVATWNIVVEKARVFQVDPQWGPEVLMRTEDGIRKQYSTCSEHSIQPVNVPVSDLFLYRQGTVSAITFRHELYPLDHTTVPPDPSMELFRTHDKTSNTGNAHDRPIYIVPQTGEVLVAKSYSGVGKFRFVLVAIDYPSMARAIVRDWVFESVAGDECTPENGPQGRGCSNGATAIDAVPFDQEFTCDCKPGNGAPIRWYGDPNCDDLQADYRRGIRDREVIPWFIFVFAFVDDWLEQQLQLRTYGLPRIMLLVPSVMIMILGMVTLMDYYEAHMSAQKLNAMRAAHEMEKERRRHLLNPGEEPTHSLADPMAVFHVPCMLGHVDKMRSLLKCAPDDATRRELLVARDTLGRTPLIAAVMAGQKASIDFMIEFAPDTLEMGEAVGVLPVHAACLRGYTDIARFLLEKVPDGSVDRQDSNGRTPLFSAAEGGFIEVVRMLLIEWNARCAVSDRNLHSRMPWDSSRVFTPLTGWHCKLRPNTEGRH
jgi:hypothetical protein